jgi:hypothetical protein
MLIEEIWQDILGFVGFYQISNYGRAKSLERCDSKGRQLKEKILKPKIDRNGYFYVRLSKNGKWKNFSISRLVALHFIPNPENKKEVNHFDGNKSNNHELNLQWCTRSENCLHAYKFRLKDYKEENNPNSKLNWGQVNIIRAMLNEKNEKGTKKYTQKNIADIFNVSSHLIQKIKLNKIWKYT